jgi:1,2-diacylglycerol 3-alpha-glucosyltransferase
MTIGIFLEHYDPFISGVITSIKGLRQELESRGHTVYIVAPAVKGYRDNDSRTIRVPSIATKSIDNATLGYPSRRVIKRLMAIKFDVIHSQDVFYTSNIGRLVAKRQNIPYIQTYHTLWHKYLQQYPVGLGLKLGGSVAMTVSYPFLFGLKTTGDFLKKYPKELAGPHRLSNLVWQHMVNMSRQADAVIVPSAHLKDSLARVSVETQLHHIPNGLVKSHYPGKILPPPRPATLRIISVGRFSPEKRLDVLIKSMARLKFDAELIMVGDGPEFSAVEKLAFQSGLGQKVRFMGHLENAAVRQLMRESDIFCLASYDFDNQPMVILEALDAGLPIIYCDHKLSDGLQPQNSLLSGRAPEDFATAIGKLRNSGMRKKMATASKNLAPNYDVSYISNRLLGVYRAAGATA